MFIDTFKRLIFTDNPSVIEWMVLQALEDGEDLCADPFVMAGQFCQWVTRRETMYEYKLVTAHLPSEFEDWVKRYSSQGYELALAPVDWNGMMCQWMARVRADGETYAGVVSTDEAVSTPMPGYKMVERAQVLGGLSSVNFLPRSER